MMVALNCICAWICLPVGDISFTLQTFSVLLTLGLLGGKLGTLTIGVYLLLGTVGFPVFSGFRGGLGVLLGTSGGYLWGFLATGLVYWLICHFFGKSHRLGAMILGLTACYALGTLWYALIYLDGSAIAMVLLKCVVPFLFPDAIKLALAYSMTARLSRMIT
jgi:biotin transport system substrate-specific component